MKRETLLWIIAVLVTVSSAVYQRMTGPTYPVSGKTVFAGEEIQYRFERSHSVSSDCSVSVSAADSAVRGFLHYKRYKSYDEWTAQPMARKGGNLTGSLPKQPAAGKLMYRVELVSNAVKKFLTDEPVVIRFKGDVPLWILIPHVIFMFAMMLLSTRTGLEIFNPLPAFRKLTYWTVGLVIIGGLILGPITQYYAFGAFWTGFPYGHDLTDNKTLIAFLVWAAALGSLFFSKKPARWIAAAALITLVVFLIPHSVLGSEIDHTKIPR